MSVPEELVVIGAGPAGMAAASTAAAHGVDTLLLDEQSTPGGQIYRGIEQALPAHLALLGKDYEAGSELVKAFRDSGARYQPDTAVWSLGSQGEIGILQHGKASLLKARRVVLAGGAMERPVPFPGWTLPGVMNAGGAQILMKASALVPADGVVIAGTGPLLILLAWQYQRAGVPVKAILELSPPANLLRAIPRLPGALHAGHYLTRGLRYLYELRRAGIKVSYGVADLEAEGGERLEAVTYRRAGRQHRLETSTLLVHFGLVPGIQLTEAAGCEHVWNEGQQCWCPKTDQWGNSTVPAIAVVGDGAAIGGAVAALHAGRLAGLAAAHALGHIDEAGRDRLAARDRKWMHIDLKIRPFLEALHRLPDALLSGTGDSTLVCRCEEITAGEVRAAVRAGHRDPNQVKFITRCGMGPCQGRQCGPAVAGIVAAACDKPLSEVQPYRVRPPLRPLSINELATLDAGSDAA
jgi:NADPH-dependent 2,4-dienoyl-CoA reductase/sulfur reductase-like enzyme